MSGRWLLATAVVAGGGAVVAAVVGGASPGRRRSVAPQLEDRISTARAAPPVLVVQHGPEETTVLTADSRSPGSRWQRLGPRLWRAPVGRARPRAPAAPVLLTVGRIGEDDIVVNLAAIGELAVIGEPAPVDAALRQFWAELRWPAEDDGPAVELCDPPRDLPAAGSGLVGGRDRDRVTLAWKPTTPDSVGQGSRVVGGGRGRWRLVVTTTEAVLEPLGLELSAVWPLPPGSPTRARRLPTRRVEPLRIRVLGPPRVDGASRPLRPQARELVLYLATHPDGVTEEQLRTALWPGRDAKRGRFNNLVSEVRGALGRDDDGAWRFPRATDGRYRLANRAGCDLTELERALDAARSAATAEAADALADALGAVRGAPFAGMTQARWVFEEAVAARAEAVVTAAAQRLAELAAELGRPSLATWAITKALAAVADPELRELAAASG